MSGLVKNAGPAKKAEPGAKGKLPKKGEKSPGLQRASSSSSVDYYYKLDLSDVNGEIQIRKGIMPSPEEIKRIMDAMDLQEPSSADEMDDDSASLELNQEQQAASLELNQEQQAALDLVNALRVAFDSAYKEYNHEGMDVSESQDSLGDFSVWPPSPSQSSSQSQFQYSFPLPPPPPPPSRTGSFESSGSTKSSGSNKSILAFSNKVLKIGDVVTMLKPAGAAAAATTDAEIAELLGDLDEAEVEAQLNFVPLELPDEPGVVPPELPDEPLLPGVVPQTRRIDLDSQIDAAFNELMAVINTSLASGVTLTWWALLTGLNKLLRLIAQALKSGATFAWYYPKITMVILGFAYLQSPFCAFLIRKTLGFAWWVLTTVGSMTTGGQAIAAGYDKMIIFITRAAEIIDWCREKGIVTLEQFNALIANVNRLTEMADALKIDQAELLQILLALSEAFGANAAAGAAPSFLASILQRVGMQVAGDVVVPLVLGRIGAAANQGLLMAGGGKRKNRKKNTRKKNTKKKKTLRKYKKSNKKSKRK